MDKGNSKALDFEGLSFIYAGSNSPLNSLKVTTNMTLKIRTAVVFVGGSRLRTRPLSENRPNT